MNRIKTTVSAVAALLVLAGCGASEDAPEPVPDDPATSAVATSAPPSTLPSVSPTTAAPAPTAASPSGVLSLADSCRAVLDDQRDALDAVRAYIRNPLADDVDVDDLDRLRSELLAGELSAPEPLRQELNTQVGVLNRLVQGIQDGNVRQIDVDGFADAQERITTLCGETRG